jgi:hypothetical protein
MPKPTTLFPLRIASKEKTPIEQQIVDAGLPEPEQEYRFAPERKWAFDFCWPPQRIALEIEGGAFGRYIVITNGYERRKGQSIPMKPGTVIRVGGRHNTGSGMEADCDKYSWAAILGWCVVRATTTMVRDGKAIELLRHAFRQQRSKCVNAG